MKVHKATLLDVRATVYYDDGLLKPYTADVHAANSVGAIVRSGTFKFEADAFDFVQIAFREVIKTTEGEPF